MGDKQSLSVVSVVIMINDVLANPGSSSLAMYVLLVEYVGKRHLHVVGTALFYFWVASLMLLALFAYLIKDWRTLSIAVPGLVQIFFWW